MKTAHKLVIAVLRVRLDDEALAAQVTVHLELEDFRREVHPALLLLCVVPHSARDVLSAPIAPHIHWHLEADDHDALAQLPGTSPERMVLPNEREEGEVVRGGIGPCFPSRGPSWAGSSSHRPVRQPAMTWKQLVTNMPT